MIQKKNQNRRLVEKILCFMPFAIKPKCASPSFLSNSLLLLHTISINIWLFWHRIRCASFNGFRANVQQPRADIEYDIKKGIVIIYMYRILIENILFCNFTENLLTYFLKTWGVYSKMFKFLFSAVFNCYHLYSLSAWIIQLKFLHLMWNDNVHVNFVWRKLDRKVYERQVHRHWVICWHYMMFYLLFFVLFFFFILFYMPPEGGPLFDMHLNFVTAFLRDSFFL